MNKTLAILTAVSALAYTSTALSAACSNGGGSLSPADTTAAQNIINNLVHPYDTNTIHYVDQCFNLPLSDCQMIVDFNLHTSATEPTPHMTWRIGKSNTGIYTSPVRTLHIFDLGGDNYGFDAFTTGGPNKDTPCE